MITNDTTLAKNILENEGIIAIPTETVYGLAANAFNKEAIHKVYQLKKRPLHNPLIVHIKSIAYLHEVAQDVPQKAIRLAESFWPGPLTLVLKRQSVIPDIITAGKETVAVRMPNHPLTLQLLNQLDFPLAAPSANPFGCISPTCAEHVARYFQDDLRLILDGGNCERGIESTIIGFQNDEPILYRLGSLSIEEIESVTGPIQLKTTNDISPEAPGMLDKHYSPKTPTYFTSNVEEMSRTFSGKKIGVLSFQEKIMNVKIKHQEILSSKGDLKEAASKLYAAMHHLDLQQLDVILAEKFPEIGLGKVINDRLARAAKQ